MTLLNRARTSFEGTLKKQTLQIVSILSAAFTLFSNAEGLISFSSFISKLAEVWRQVLAWPIDRLLSFFSLSVDIIVASSLTSMLIIFAIGLSSRAGEATAVSRATRLFGFAFVTLVSIVYSILLAMPSATHNFMLMRGDLLYFAVAATTYSVIFVSPIFIPSIARVQTWRTWTGCTIFAVTTSVVCAVGIDSLNIDDLTRDTVVRMLLPAIFPLAALVSKPDSFLRRNINLCGVLLSLYLLNYFMSAFERYFGPVPNS